MEQSKPFIIRQRRGNSLLPPDSEEFNDEVEDRIRFLQSSNIFLICALSYQCIRYLYYFLHYRNICYTYAILCLVIIGGNILWVISSTIGFFSINQRSSQHLARYLCLSWFVLFIRLFTYFLVWSLLEGYAQTYYEKYQASQEANTVDESQESQTDQSSNTNTNDEALICASLYQGLLMMIQAIIETIFIGLIIYYVVRVRQYLKSNNAQYIKNTNKIKIKENKNGIYNLLMLDIKRNIWCYIYIYKFSTYFILIHIINLIIIFKQDHDIFDLCPICDGYFRFAHIIDECGHTCNNNYNNQILVCFVCILNKSECPRCAIPINNKKIRKDPFIQHIVDTLYPEFSTEDQIILTRLKTIFGDKLDENIVQNLLEEKEADSYRSKNEQNQSNRLSLVELVNEAFKQKITYDQFRNGIYDQEQFNYYVKLKQTLEKEDSQIKYKLHLTGLTSLDKQIAKVDNIILYKNHERSLCVRLQTFLFKNLKLDELAQLNLIDPTKAKKENIILYFQGKELNDSTNQQFSLLENNAVYYDIQFKL